MSDGPSYGFRRNLRGFRFQYSSNFAEVKKCAESGLGKVQREVKNLIRPGEDLRLLSVRQTKRYGAFEKLIDSNAQRHMTQSKVQFDVGSLRMCQNGMMIPGAREGKRITKTVTFPGQYAHCARQVFLANRKIYIHGSFPEKRDGVVTAREQWTLERNSLNPLPAQ